MSLGLPRSQDVFSPDLYSLILRVRNYPEVLVYGCQRTDYPYSYWFKGIYAIYIYVLYNDYKHPKGYLS